MVMNNNQLAGENVQKMAELKSKDEDIAALRKELAKVSKIRDALQRKWKQTEDQKMESEQKRESLRQQILGMERGNVVRIYYMYVHTYIPMYIQYVYTYLYMYIRKCTGVSPGQGKWSNVILKHT